MMLPLSPVMLLFARGVGAIAIPKPPSADNVSIFARARIDDSFDCFDSAPKSEFVPHASSAKAKLGIAVQRKTGFVLAGHATRCFPDGMVQRLTGNKMISDDTSLRRVHIARDPIDMAVSNFLYNKFTSNEVGTLKPGSAGHHLKVCTRNNKYIARTLPPSQVDESLRHYLTRVNEHHGIVLTLCSSMPQLVNLGNVSRICRSQWNCHEVRLETFMKDSKSFWKTWEDIASFAGLNLDKKARACLREQDIHDDNFVRENHCSSRDVSSLERIRIKKAIAWTDAQVFRGKYKEAGKLMMG